MAHFIHVKNIFRNLAAHMRVIEFRKKNSSRTCCFFLEESFQSKSKRVWVYKSNNESILIIIKWLKTLKSCAKALGPQFLCLSEPTRRVRVKERQQRWYCVVYKNILICNVGRTMHSEMACFVFNKIQDILHALDYPIRNCQCWPLHFQSIVHIRWVVS